MSASNTPKSQNITATVEFTVSGNLLRARIPVPAGRARPSDLLPAARAVADAVVGIASEQSLARGRPISCHAGCGACCRQLVPISEPEARALRALVDAMPGPRRTAILARFRNARKRLADARLLDLLSDADNFPYEQIRSVALTYFRLGIPCPFLDDESCSIYPDRPIVCREYLVTSDPAHCAVPTPEAIQMVPLATKVSSALVRVGLREGMKHARWVPLILALDWAKAHPDEAPERPGAEMLQELFRRMAERRDEEPALEVDAALPGSPNANADQPAGTSNQRRRRKP